MPSKARLLQNGFTRVFTQEGGAGPGNAPTYQGLAKASSPAWPQGDITPIRVPSPDAYDRFDTVGTIKGAQGLPSLSVDFRMQATLSSVLRLVRKGCPVDIQVHVGSCKNPADFNGGWTDGKVIVLQGANATDYGSDDLGALDSGDRSVVTETIPFTGLDYFEIGPVSPTAMAAALISDEIVDVAICDSVTCGNCGLPSDGCQVVFALQGESSGSPGIGPAVFYTIDGGATWAKSILTSAALTDVARHIACVGSYLVVTTGGAAGGHHYIPIADITAGLGGWVKVSSGYTLAAGAPNAIVSTGPSSAWIAGDGGYIYKMTDPTAAVVAQQSGSLTAQNLLGIHAYDDLALVAVGASNAVLFTKNGGVTWSLVTGPAVGIQLNTVWLRSEQEWIVGTNDGKLWYTRNGGTSFTEKAFSGSGAGTVNAIVFSNPVVGWMAHATAGAVARVFRTINGGYSWYSVPEGGGSFVTGRKVDALAACAQDPNVAFGGGLYDANDGLLVKIA